MYYNIYNAFEPNRPSIIDLIVKRAEWDVLQKSLDKCHVLCFQCEPIVDDLLLQLNYEEEKHKLRICGAAGAKSPRVGSVNPHSYSQPLESNTTYCEGLPEQSPPDNYTEQWTFYRDDYNEKMEEIIQSLSGLYANTL